MTCSQARRVQSNRWAWLYDRATTPAGAESPRPKFLRMCNRYAADIREAGREKGYWGFDEWSETRINRQCRAHMGAMPTSVILVLLSKLGCGEPRAHRIVVAPGRVCVPLGG